MRRRTFIQSLSALAGAGLLGAFAWTRWGRGEAPAAIRGSIIGANSHLGHLIRDRAALPPPTETIRTGIVIVGGGISGLAAAWELQRTGRKDFLLLELEDKLGGNAAWGENSVSRYPWGAHYLPVPDPDSTALIAFLESIGAVEGYENGLPRYKEEYLCFAPQERLLLHGRWQEGIIPRKGVPAGDLAQIEAFLAEMNRFKTLRGKDGRKAFHIPLDDSSQDEAFLVLDKINMPTYLAQHGWTSSYLHWYVDYCTRDDYGTRMEDVSAWAGIHYFASRTGVGANAPDGSVLTWPEGNGWLVQQMAGSLPPAAIRTGALVTAVDEKGVTYYSPATQKSIRVEADAIIMATPQFVGHRLLGNREPLSPDFSYAPWMVANITLNSLPHAGAGAPLSWDNVIYGAPSLGYVVATHQRLGQPASAPEAAKSVWTYYRPLSELQPVEARKAAYTRSYEAWQAIILQEISHAHPDIMKQIATIDVWLWGHGMVRPVPGFVWGETRKKAANPLKNIYFAHTDLAGVSIFEEAFYQGIRAAGRVTKIT